jgi:hypothetical protein
MAALGGSDLLAATKTKSPFSMIDACHHQFSDMKGNR